jgi:predicted nucleotidyltransferase
MSAPLASPPADPIQHPAMRRFAAAVRTLYGDRVERIVLDGARARGDARPDSDWDVAVSLHRPLHWWGEVCRLADTSVDLLNNSGAVMSDGALTTFLARGCELKTESDDGDQCSDDLTRAEAVAIMVTATRLVAHAEWLLAQPEPSPPS